MLRVWCDRRIGGIPTYVLSETGAELLQVPDEIRKCVVFLCAEREGRPRATAFLIAYKLPDTPDFDYYLVTASHCVDGREEVWVRLNLKGGGTRWLSTATSQWYRHPQHNDPQYTDVAVLPFSVSSDLDILPFPVNTETPEGVLYFKSPPITPCATDDVVRELGIGVGDDVFLPGLFVNHSGKDRNIPIVRVGNIAAMPEEPVRTRLGVMDAYLIEARSIGGLSGSPVFVHIGPFRWTKRRDEYDKTTGHLFYLLGLMHGHFQVEVAKEREESGFHEEAVNMGVAIVPPVTKMLETLEHPTLVRRRQLAAQEINDRMLPVPDMDSGADRPEDYGRFEALTQKVVQVPKNEIANEDANPDE